MTFDLPETAVSPQRHGIHRDCHVLVAASRNQSRPCGRDYAPVGVDSPQWPSPQGVSNEVTRGISGPNLDAVLRMAYRAHLPCISPPTLRLTRNEEIILWLGRRRGTNKLTRRSRSFSVTRAFSSFNLCQPYKLVRVTIVAH